MGAISEDMPKNKSVLDKKGGKYYNGGVFAAIAPDTPFYHSLQMFASVFNDLQQVRMKGWEFTHETGL